jgi:hypothetical protein
VKTHRTTEPAIASVPFQPSPAERANQVLVIMAHSLAHIDELIGDLVTLVQQQSDLLRRLINEQGDE